MPRYLVGVFGDDGDVFHMEDLFVGWGSSFLHRKRKRGTPASKERTLTGPQSPAAKYQVGSGWALAALGDGTTV